MWEGFNSEDRVGYCEKAPQKKNRPGQGKEEETFSGGRDLQPLSSLTA